MAGDEGTTVDDRPLPQDRHVLLEDLSLEQKISLLSGSGLWTVPGVPNAVSGITVSDGPHGVRKPLNDLSLQVSHPATCFPAGCAVAATWNVDALRRLGKGLSKECELYHISVLLGPAMNLKRHPAGGRNLEYYSEDPYLTGTLAGAYVQGVQASQTVGACLKHFAVNNQESHRFVVNVIVDERTLRELYLRSFEIAVQAEKPAMIMGAYNRLNGEYCCEHKWLLTDVLREEWNYEGVCVTDWGATNNRVQAVRAGLDLEMPGNKGVHRRSLLQACREDPAFETRYIDQSVNRTLQLLQQYPTPSAAEPKQQIFDENHLLAYEIALESVVLLKNEEKLLPLAQNVKLGVIGEFVKESRYQGMGSSKCTPTRVDHAWDALLKYTSNLEYAPGYQALANGDVLQPDLVKEAMQVATRCDVVLLFLGLPEILESEGFDRETIQLPKQHVALLEGITATHKKVVVVLSNGGAVELPECISKVSCILEGYLLGQAGGPAIVDLIFGKVSPSGRLPETLPVTVDQLPSHAFFPGTREVVEYREGLNVGYRYLDTVCSFDKSRVRYPFGHGLTYTEFEYSQLGITIKKDESSKKQVQIHFRLSNVGQVAAKEVPQCYVAPLHPSIHRPAHELKAFTKVHLDPGESQIVSYDLSQDAFAYYDIGHGAWTVELGEYEIQVGASSQDIRLQQTIAFQSGIPASNLAKESYPLEGGMSTDDEAFAKRFGPRKERVLDSIQQRNEPGREALTRLDRNSLLKEAATQSLLGKGLLLLVFKIGCRQIPPGPMETAEVCLVRANVENLPLRSIILFSGGALSMEFMDTLIAIMNGKPLEAVRMFGTMIGCGIKGVFGR